MNYIRFEEIYGRAADLIGYSESEVKETIGEPDREFSSEDGNEQFLIYPELEIGLAIKKSTGNVTGVVIPYQPDEDKVLQGYYDVLGLKVGDDTDRIYQMWGTPSEVYPDVFIYNTKLGETTRGHKYQVELSIENGRLKEFNCILVSPEKANSKGACFVATACYDNYDAPEVLVLRRYRDNVLLKNKLGKTIVKIYYFSSPPFARMIKKSDSLKQLIRNYLLRPIILKLKAKYDNGK